LIWTTASEENVSKFNIEYSTGGSTFSVAGEVVATGRGSGAAYSFTHTITNAIPLFYRLQIIERDGSSSYSSVIRINAKDNSYKVYPTVVRDGRLQINSSEAISNIQLLNNTGSLVYEKNLGSVSGQLTIQLPALSKGVYIVRIVGRDTHSEKILID
jgi:hypothetical protein